MGFAAPFGLQVPSPLVLVSPHVPIARRNDVVGRADDDTSRLNRLDAMLVVVTGEYPLSFQFKAADGSSHHGRYCYQSLP